MRTSLPLLSAVVSFLLMSTSKAMFIDFGNFKLDEKELQTKTRYVYSDHKEDKEQPLENATAKFDMAVHQENYDFLKNDSKQFGEDYLRLYVVMGSSESLQKLQYATKQNDEYLDYANLTYSYLLRPMKNDFTYYKEMDMKSDNTPENRINGPEVGGNTYGNSSFSKDDPMTLQDEQKVSEEGVYYTSYLFEVITKEKLENEQMFADKNLEMSEHDEHLKYLINVDKNSADALQDNYKDPFGKETNSSKVGSLRRNLKSHWEYKKFGTPHFDRKFLHDKYQEDYSTRPRLIITGNVTFTNTDGFLSAQEYRNIEINQWFLTVFVVSSAIWTLFLYLYRKQILPIHYMVSIILYACTFEVMFTYIFYEKENTKLGDYRTFWVFIIFMEIVRSVFARAAILITALGQSITTQNIGTEKYVPIVIVNFMYGASLLAATVMNEMQQNHNISDQAVFAAELPNQIINLIIAVWIVVAFRNTLRTLSQDDQEKKKRVVLQLFVFFCICLAACGAIFIYDQWGRSGATSDQVWEDFAMHTSSYFILFTIMVLGSAVILRPSNPKLSETFNNYNDLSNDDKDELTGRNKYPDSAPKFQARGTELQDFNPMDPGDLGRRQRIRD